MHTEIRPIDDMPHLKARLGKARTDRIRYVGKADSSKQKHATNIENTVIDRMQYVTLHQPGCPIADVLTGVSYMDHQSIPLSINRLYTIIQCVETINTREVMAMLDVDKRQAQRYVRAVKFALPHISSLV